MSNISTDALAPWDRPSWTDGNIALHDQFNLTAHEARIGRWCFDGDGDDGGDDGTGLTDADFEDFEGIGPQGQGVADYADVEGTDLGGGYSTGIGYNDLEDMGVFDATEAAIAEADKQQAAAIQQDAYDKGYDVQVGVDPDGTFSYNAGPEGSFADVAAVAGSQMAKGLMDLSPTMQIAQALGAPTPDFSLTAKNPGISYGGLDDSMMGGAPVSAISMSSLPGDGLTPDEQALVAEAQAEQQAQITDEDYFNAMVEAENAIGGGGYYDEVFGNENMAPANEGGDNPMVATGAPVAAPVAPEPPPTFLSSYQPPQFTPAPVNRLGLLAPPQIYGSTARQQMIQNYIDQYPTLDQAFSRQLG